MLTAGVGLRYKKDVRNKRENYAQKKKRVRTRIASRLSLVAYTSVIPVYRLDVNLEYTLDEKKASRSQQEASLREAVDEALNQDQTERDLFLSAVGCTVESAFDDMRLIKKMWHKEKGVQGFHLVQSFAPGEASPELAHQIGQEFAQKLLNGKFQVIISTHLNTKCIHNHLVWNSVSLTNGKKYRSNQKSYITRIRRISDELRSGGRNLRHAAPRSGSAA